MIPKEVDVFSPIKEFEVALKRCVQDKYIYIYVYVHLDQPVRHKVTMKNIIQTQYPPLHTLTTV